MMTREQICKVIDDGGTVLHKGVVYSEKSKVPTAEQLAKDDVPVESTRVHSLEAQVSALQAEIAKVDALKKAEVEKHDHAKHGKK